MGISVSFWLNNLNESLKKSKTEEDLVNLLILDLENKKNEHLSDIRVAKKSIERISFTLNTWETSKKIDTTYLKENLGYLRLDTMYLNELSPIYNGLSNTELWDNLPENIINDVSNLFRLSYTGLKIKFQKLSEYSTHCKLNFLLPNDLILQNIDIKELYKKVKKVDKEFILYTKLTLFSVEQMKESTESIIVEIEDLINLLKIYNKTKP